MGITPERQRTYDFTTPYETFRISLFVRKSTSDIHELDDLIEKRVGAVETNQGLALIKNKGIANIEIYKSPEELLMALLSGSVDAAVYPEQIFQGISIKAGLENQIKTTGAPLQEIKRGIAVRKGETELLQKLDNAVQQLIGMPEYKQIYQNWYGSPTLFWNMRRVIWAMVCLLGVTIVAMLAWRYISVFRINRVLSKNIQELKDTQKSLNRALLWESEAVKAASVGLWDWNLITNQVIYSKEWKKQIGYEDHEIGNDFEEWESRVHPDDLLSTLEQVQNSIDRLSQAHSVRFRFRHKNGDYRWILAQSSVISDESDRPIKMVGSHIDITENKNLEEKLSESEVKYRHLYETMTQNAVIQDAEGKVIEANQAACRIMGLNMDQMLGITASDPRWKMIHEDGSPYDPADVPANIALRTGKPVKSVHCGIYVPEKDDYHWILVGSVPRFKSGDSKPFSTMTVFTDITERKMLESKLQQAQRIESIGNLAGGIAHDFNNILSSILGFTELAMADVQIGSPQQENLKEVFIAGNRAKQLVQQILAFARQSNEETKPVRLSDIVNEALKLLRPSTPSSIDIIPTIDSTSRVMENESQLHQIVMNLCTNAVQALQESGTVLEIELRDTSINYPNAQLLTGLPAGEYVELVVADNGPGISPAIIGKIFEPYFTTKEVGEGTGMGLAMVKGIIEGYGGDIQVKSQPGKRTAFTIRLPSSKSLKKDTMEKTELFSSGIERILFVDDEPALTRLGSRMLEGLGYGVTALNSSPEALALFKEKPEDFDLVITDMTMPVMTGDLLSAALRKIRPEIPIILCTGYNSKISNHQDNHPGINVLAFKPLSKADLARMIREVLDAR